ncbi:MAG: hypothetical protein LUG85_09330 [Clostridiales bacterium]|nr:hypothetical protein [Clostridiales bacterium]
MLIMLFDIFKLWKMWRKDWDTLCNCCGKCCYVRDVQPDGSVFVDYDRPCEYLDTETNLCTVYDERFRKCDHCGKITIFTALFNPTLPKDCPYVRTFRLWEEKKEK